MNEIKLWVQCVFWDIWHIWETLWWRGVKNHHNHVYVVYEWPKSTQNHTTSNLLEEGPITNTVGPCILFVRIVYFVHKVYWNILKNNVGSTWCTVNYVIEDCFEQNTILNRRLFRILACLHNSIAVSIVRYLNWYILVIHSTKAIFLEFLT